MAKEDKPVEIRISKYLNWFKNPYNFWLSVILIVAFAVRFYSFWITKNQGVWWDEGEYLLRMRHIVLGTPESGFSKARELFTPYFWGMIYYFFKSEIAIRFVQVLISTLTVFVTYFFAKETYGKKVGLISSVLMSFFWLHLFFTTRLLTYLYAPLFYTLALALFIKGHYSEDNKIRMKYLLWSFIIIVLGLGVYYSIGFAALTIGIYLLLTKRFRIFKDKILIKAALFSLPLLLVSFIPSYFIQGHIIPRLNQVAGITQSQTGAGLAGLFTYVKLMPNLLLGAYLIILFISLIYLFRTILTLDIVFKEDKDSPSHKDLFVLISALVPFALYTWLSMVAGGGAGASYDAWILPVFPALFAFMARSINGINDYTREKIKDSFVKNIITIILLAIILFGAYNQYNYAKNAIIGKSDSYFNLRPAGEWIKENSQKDDVIISTAVPEMTYYTEREVITYTFNWGNGTKMEFLDLVKERKPKYLVLTVWEKSPDWAYELPGTKDLNLTLANTYSIIYQGKKQPDVAIYTINY